MSHTLKHGDYDYTILQGWPVNTPDKPEVHWTFRLEELLTVETVRIASSWDLERIEPRDHWLFKGSHCYADMDAMVKTDLYTVHKPLYAPQMMEIAGDWNEKDMCFNRRLIITFKVRRAA